MAAGERDAGRPEACPIPQLHYVVVGSCLPDRSIVFIDRTPAKAQVISLTRPSQSATLWHTTYSLLGAAWELPGRLNCCVILSGTLF